MATQVVELPDQRSTPSELVRSLVTGTWSRGDTRIRMLVLVLLALTALGVVGVIGRLVGGVADRSHWGYYAATVSFLLVAGAGAPAASIMTSLTKANWSRSIVRISQLFAVVGIVAALLELPLVFALPPLVENGLRRRSIWLGAPPYMPHVWDSIAVFGLVFTGLALLWVNAIPDLAVIRDTGGGWRQRWARRLSPHFAGTSNQWTVLRMRIGVIGAFYLLLLLLVQLEFNSDFAMSLAPGWISAILPMYSAVSALQCGLALTIVAAYFIRKYGHLEEHLGVSQFAGLGRILFVFSVLWFYFFFSGFIVLWFGRGNSDIDTIHLIFNGPYWWAMLPAFILNFVLPISVFIWNRLRISIGGPTLVALSVILGTLLDRVRLYGGAWLTSDPFATSLKGNIPTTRWPDVFDIFVFIGAFALVALLYVIASRFIGTISLWEVHQQRLLSKPGRYLHTEGTIVAKPD